MKKLIAIFFISFISFFVFSEDFDLFPKNTLLDEATSYFVINGWKISINKSNNTLQCEPNDTDCYFHKYKITTLSFSMDKNGYIDTQTVVLANPPRTALEAYNIMMEIACDYKSTFTNRTIKRDEGINYAYFAYTPDYNSCVYVVSGINDMYFLTLLFGNVEK